VREAMAAGVPVVVSCVGGLPDQMIHRRTGLVVDPQDPEGLAAALVSLLLAPDEARQLGEAGRAYAARFPHGALVGRMEEVCSEAHLAQRLRHRRRPGRGRLHRQAERRRPQPLPDPGTPAAARTHPPSAKSWPLLAGTGAGP
jgi:hypothetical protein